MQDTPRPPQPKTSAAAQKDSSCAQTCNETPAGTLNTIRKPTSRHGSHMDQRPKYEAPASRYQNYEMPASRHGSVTGQLHRIIDYFYLTW